MCGDPRVRPPSPPCLRMEVQAGKTDVGVTMGMNPKRELVFKEDGWEMANEKQCASVAQRGCVIADRNRSG